MGRIKNIISEIILRVSNVTSVKKKICTIRCVTRT